ncbi:MAG: nuclear transport factor 2 family protein [Halioglobus sp.]|nr:nuclear transport factor 2 family protein [Halioglobus sp.]
METSPGMPPTAEALAQREAIRDILSTHSRGLDRLDPDLLKHAYWPDAEVDYGAFKGSAHQFAEIISPALSSQFELTQHLLGQTLITLDGDRANSETYVYARHLLLGAEQELAFAGRYLDQLECRDGQWKIAHRRVVMDWCHRVAVDDERSGDAFGALSKGSNGVSDPSYDLFGTL